ncbi:MAG: RNA polymerase sigma factor [Muribaculaceae bacterium]|nr:RNA polymerase sigma factor [Muribaculaceae bacterium]MDE6552553.1 RNA polymerase sigma factor [Muribaculaceae bacterium]
MNLSIALPYMTTTTTLTTMKNIILRFAATLGIAPESTRLHRLFDCTVADHDAMIRRICLGYARTSQDLEDLYQDVLVNIWRGLPSFREDSSIRTWVYRIALNTCVSTLRSRSRQPAMTSLDEVILVPDKSLEKKETVKELYECIATLGPIDKAIVMMWLDEYSYEEIADTIGIKRNNVATRLHRAKEKLKSKIKY